ncbi:imidazole glycerol phosphate synthase subunit HisH [Candidatus Halobeggiatoa sp. HSG11]|nr:imidazole glycerol phosphate synthase subunit HisH [Candidatus Halobeggiatoa sp. HSG11]
MKTVAVIDYGMSNLRSVSKALEHVAGNEWQVIVSNKAEVILGADKIVFPGQGAIGNCMSLLEQTGISDAIKQALDNEKPFLGICLGLQTLLTGSEENGGITGFNWIAGTVRNFAKSLDLNNNEHLKIPHMGWNQVQQTQNHPLWTNIPSESRFYFVHSYYVEPINNSVITGTTSYGNLDFVSVIAQDNVFAVQFHPEKSQHMGLTLLNNFLDW